MADVAKKIWRKPEVRVLEAGSAETKRANGAVNDGGTKAPNTTS